MKVNDKVIIKETGAQGRITEVLDDAIETQYGTLFLVNFGEAGNCRLFESELTLIKS